MRHSGFRAWKAFSGLAAVALLSVGCGRLPETGGYRQGDPPRDFFGGPVGHATPEMLSKYQYRSDRGFNGTIAEVGSSIDPRTSEMEGTTGRSRLTDVTGYTGRPDIAAGADQAPTSQGIGGSGEWGQSEGTNDASWRSSRGTVTTPSARGHQEQQQGQQQKQQKQQQGQQQGQQQ